MFYAHAVGIDYVDDKYVIYAQILNFSTLGKQEGGGKQSGGQDTVWIGKGTGTTLDTAIHNLYTTSERKIYWGHLVSMVLSENALKHGIENVIDILARNNETRYTLWVFGSQNSIEQILKTSPILENSPVYSKLGDPRDIYNQSSYVPPIRLHRFIAEIREPGRTVLLPILSVTTDQWAGMKKKQSTLKYDGIEIIQNGKLKGSLCKSDIQGIRWMTKHTTRAPVVVFLQQRLAAVLICENPKVKITPVLSSGKVFFHLRLKVTANITEMNQSVSEIYIRREAAKLIKDEIQHTYAEGLKMGADVLHLSQEFYRDNPSEWNKMIRDGQLPLTFDSLQSVDVNLKIVTSGKSMMR